MFLEELLLKAFPMYLGFLQLRVANANDLVCNEVLLWDDPSITSAK